MTSKVLPIRLPIYWLSILSLPIQCLSLLLVLLSPTDAQAYGSNIHKGVCDIVWQRLPSEQKHWLGQLVRQSDLSRFSTGCAWPDWIKKQQHYQMTRPWHYQDYFDNDVTSNAVFSNDCSKGCLLAAIEHSFWRLSNQPVPNDDFALPQDFSQAEALFFLGHLLVDLHQPLHVGRAEDNGGNKITVYWQANEYRLHQWWDGRLLRLLQPSWKSRLRKMAQAQSMTLDQHTPLRDYLRQWLRESRQIAEQDIYPHYSQNKVLSPETEMPFAETTLSLLLKSLSRLEALIGLAYSEQH